MAPVEIVRLSCARPPSPLFVWVARLRASRCRRSISTSSSTTCTCERRLYSYDLSGALPVAPSLVFDPDLFCSVTPARASSRCTHAKSIATRAGGSLRPTFWERLRLELRLRQLARRWSASALTAGWPGIVAECPGISPGSARNQPPGAVGTRPESARNTPMNYGYLSAVTLFAVEGVDLRGSARRRCVWEA